MSKHADKNLAREALRFAAAELEPKGIKIMRTILFSLTALLALGLSPQAPAAFAASPLQANSPPASKTAKTVHPGEQHTNNDGVTVDNSKDSGGNAKIDPKNGNAGSETEVSTKTGFDGSIDGIDHNDTVDLGSSNTVTVSGNGGTVNLSGNSTATISNGTSGGNMTINLPSGTTITLPPGSTTTVAT